MNFQVFTESYFFNWCKVKDVALGLMMWLCVFSYFSGSVCAQLMGPWGEVNNGLETLKATDRGDFMQRL